MAPGSRLDFRDADLVEHDIRVLHDPQPDLVRDLGGGVAGAVRLDDEALDLLVRDVPRPDQGEVRNGAGADPALGAVDHPFPALQPCRGGQPAGDVRAVVRLGQGKGADLRQGGQARQPARLLFLGAELVDHADDQLVVDPHEGREGHIGAGHLDVHEALEQLGRAVRLQAAQAVLAELGEQPEGEFLTVPVVDRGRPDPGLEEVADFLVAGLFLRGKQVDDVHQVGVRERRRRYTAGRSAAVAAAAACLLVGSSAGTSLWLHGHVSLRSDPVMNRVGSSKPLDVLVYCTVMGITRQLVISGQRRRA